MFIKILSGFELLFVSSSTIFESERGTKKGMRQADSDRKN